MLMITTVVLLNPCASLMPFALQGFKIVDTKGVSPARTAPASVFALLIAFAIAVPLTLYWQYDMGAAYVADEWAKDWAPQFGINAFVGVLEKYQSTHGALPADTVNGLARFLSSRAEPKLVATFVVMASLVLLFSAARLRFPRWPIHPVIFLIMGTWQSRVLSFSFACGWLVKILAIRFGGYSAFQRLKPLIYGLIAGEILAALFPLFVGGIYFAVTGRPPREFSVM